jgi:hypothetical protein
MRRRLVLWQRVWRPVYPRVSNTRTGHEPQRTLMPRLFLDRMSFNSFSAAAATSAALYVCVNPDSMAWSCTVPYLGFGLLLTVEVDGLHCCRRLCVGRLRGVVAAATHLDGAGESAVGWY